MPNLRVIDEIRKYRNGTTVRFKAEANTVPYIVAF